MTGFRPERDDSTTARGRGRIFALAALVLAAAFGPGCGGDDPVIPPVVRHLYHATPDGTGSDCGNLQACLDGAAAGDTIELAGGAYTTVADTLFPGDPGGGPVTAIMVARRSLVIRAAAGASAVVDGGDDRNRVGLGILEGAGAITVLGVRFTGGGTAIRATGGELHLDGCGFGGAGAWRGLVADGTALDVTGCAFADLVYEGAVLRDCSGRIARSTFEAAGTGLFTAGSDGLQLESSLFAGTGAGVRVEEGGHAALTNLTVVNTGIDPADSAAVAVASGATVTLERCIVSGSRGFGLHRRAGGSVTVSCCDFFGNLAGNYRGLADPTGTGGNLAVDPGFCDPAGADFHLGAGSPARLAACGAMGAFAGDPCAAAGTQGVAAFSRGPRLP